MTPGGSSRNSAALGAHQEALPNQKRLGNLLNGFPLLSHRDSQRGQTHRATPESAAYRIEYGAIQPIQTQLVHLIEFQRVLGEPSSYPAVCPHLGVVADPAEQSVGDSRRTAGAAGNFGRTGFVQRDP